MVLQSPPYTPQPYMISKCKTESRFPPKFRKFESSKQKTKETVKNQSQGFRFHHKKIGFLIFPIKDEATQGQNSEETERGGGDTLVLCKNLRGTTEFICIEYIREGKILSFEWGAWSNFTICGVKLISKIKISNTIGVCKINEFT